MSGTSTVPASLANLNRNYLIRIWGQDENKTPVDIIAAAPEEFSLDVSSDWQPLLSGMGDQMLERLGKTGAAARATERVANMTGYTFQNTFMTQQVWNSTSPIELRIPIKFNAVYNARSEVTTPILRLLSLCLPSEIFDTSGSTIGDYIEQFLPLHAPGPTIAGEGKGGSTYNISVSVGRVLTFTNVIITNVSAVFHTLPSREGDFIAADVDVSLRTSRILTKRNLANIFKNIQLSDGQIPTATQVPTSIGGLLGLGRGN